MPSVSSRRHKLPWSQHDVQHMRTLAKNRISARIAAGKLGRSPGAVRYKAMMEGVSFRSIDREPVRRNRHGRL